MEKDIIVQAVTGYGIIDIVVLVGIPVLRQLLRTENEDRLIPVLIIFDNSQRSECFTKAYAVGKNATIVLFQLVDDSQNSIPLKIVEHAPDFALLKTCSLVG